MASKETRTRELSRIYRRDKALKPSVVVEEARPENSPLHDEFEWRDDVAAEQHRLWQARHLIRVVEIEAEPAKPAERVVHVPVISRQGEGEYHPVSVVARSESLAQRCINELLAKCRSMQETVKQLQDASSGSEIELVPQLAEQLRILKKTLDIIAKQAV